MVTLTPHAQICEVERALLYRGSESYADDDGVVLYREADLGWADPNHTSVRWHVKGGRPPYTLTIDGELRDGVGFYDEAEGWAQISCALVNGATYFRHEDTENDYRTRFHRTEPTVDSGLKTITAVVADAVGDTATAATEIYMLLNVRGSDFVLRPGETYRFRGLLLTIPAGVQMLTGGFGSDGGMDVIIPGIPGRTSEAFIVLDSETGEEYWRYVGGRVVDPDDQTHYGPSRQAEHPHHAAFDQLVGSDGQLPDLEEE